MRIRDPGWKKVGSGIRDKHPGSATLATAALWARIKTSLKNTKWRHMQRSGQHTLARQKNNIKKNVDLDPYPDPAIRLNAATIRFLSRACHHTGIKNCYCTFLRYLFL
jgi:hypothetical protein